MNPAEKSNEQSSDRRTKLNALTELGVSPYGASYLDVAHAENIKLSFDEMEDSNVRVAGRIMALRDHGKSKFFDLQDKSGRIQCYLRKKELGDKFPVLQNIEVGDIIGVSGRVGKTRMGEITVFGTDFELLCKSLHPLPEKWHGLKNVETRYRQRFLDLISNRESFDVFVKRSAIVKEFRNILDSQGFMEVETPMMQAIPGGATARPFVTHHNTLDLDLYMRIAPELYLKQLLVGGLERVFEIGRCFRNEGISTKHNPEFTMVEIYQAYGNCEEMIKLAEMLITGVCDKVNDTREIPFGDLQLDFSSPFKRAKYMDLIAESTGIDPWDEEAAKEVLRSKGVTDIPKEHDFVLQELFDIFVEPTLIQPTFVLDHPAALTPLCRLREDEPRLSERFELFVAGMEVANAYTELNDSDLQRKLFEDQINRGSEESVGKLDETFLTSLEYGLPPAGGMGIGIDRLVMLLTNSQSIRDVLLFPQMKPKKEDRQSDTGENNASNKS